MIGLNHSRRAGGARKNKQKRPIRPRRSACVPTWLATPRWVTGMAESRGAEKAEETPGMTWWCVCDVGLLCGWGGGVG